jgi:hypothetical protein
MEKKSKAEIKKLIEELHAKRNAAPSPTGHNSDNAGKAKAFKGAKNAGRYRPKI